MRLFRCRCGQTLFFENSRCVNCGGELAWCPSCRRISRLAATGGGIVYRCENPSCRAWLRKCDNYERHNVCNRGILSPGGEAAANGPVLCDCCELNQTIPDLSVAGHAAKWARLESAKRRMMYGLDLIGLEVGRPRNRIEPKLRFDFKADVLPAGGYWGNRGETERVFTGHADGLITINIAEADDVERERARVSLGERYRTLLGHFRHEIGHYFWEVLVGQRAEVLAGFQAVFGDHLQPDYETAKNTYYAQGAPADWASRFVTPYASMHPWEDFAETFALYQEMHAAMDTATHLGLLPPDEQGSKALDRQIESFVLLGTRLNEMNRAMGLSDWFVRVVTPAVHEKLRFIDEQVRTGPAAMAFEPAAGLQATSLFADRNERADQASP